MDVELAVVWRAAAAAAAEETIIGGVRSAGVANVGRGTEGAGEDGRRNVGRSICNESDQQNRPLRREGETAHRKG